MRENVVKPAKRHTTTKARHCVTCAKRLEAGVTANNDDSTAQGLLGSPRAVSTSAAPPQRVWTAGTLSTQRAVQPRVGTHGGRRIAAPRLLGMVGRATRRSMPCRRLHNVFAHVAHCQDLDSPPPFVLRYPLIRTRWGALKKRLTDHPGLGRPRPQLALLHTRILNA